MKDEEPTGSRVSREDFAALYSQCHLDLLRYVMTLLPYRSQAEDVVQEAARALWKKADDYDPEQPFWPWAKKFAYYEVLRHRRRQAIHRKYFSEELIETLAAERDDQEPVLEEKRAVLRQCMTKLNGRARELVLQRYGGQRTLDEIAREQGRSANSLYMMMHRIRKKLATCVDRTLKEWDAKRGYAGS